MRYEVQQFLPHFGRDGWLARARQGRKTWVEWGANPVQALKNLRAFMRKHPKELR